MSRPRRRVVLRSAGCGLAPETVDVLLTGWGGPAPDHSREPASDPFEAFTLDLAEVWRQHHVWLRAEFRRRGLPGRPWAAGLGRGKA